MNYRYYCQKQTYLGLNVDNLMMEETNKQQNTKAHYSTKTDTSSPYSLDLILLPSYIILIWDIDNYDVWITKSSKKSETKTLFANSMEI